MSALAETTRATGGRQRVAWAVERGHRAVRLCPTGREGRAWGTAPSNPRVCVVCCIEMPGSRAAAQKDKRHAPPRPLSDTPGCEWPMGASMALKSLKLLLGCLRLPRLRAAEGALCPERKRHYPPITTSAISESQSGELAGEVSGCRLDEAGPSSHETKKKEKKKVHNVWKRRTLRTPARASQGSPSA